ncbi:MAG TPA: hypothetical protein DCQ08_03110 [Amoebophilaceae bacterium]|nr:hypothetical protein [Amoebophilaceae bacterium]
MCSITRRQQQLFAYHIVKYYTHQLLVANQGHLATKHRSVHAPWSQKPSTKVKTLTNLRLGLPEA